MDLIVCFVRDFLSRESPYTDEELETGFCLEYFNTCHKLRKMNKKGVQFLGLIAPALHIDIHHKG